MQPLISSLLPWAVAPPGHFRLHVGPACSKTNKLYFACMQIVAVIAGTGTLVILDMAINGGQHVQTAATALTGPFGIETIGSHFGAGAIPSSLPMPRWPEGGAVRAGCQPGLRGCCQRPTNSLLS